VEGLDIAYAMQENLDHDAEVTVWAQGVFKPSSGTLEALTNSLKLFDFALFVFSPDDSAIIQDLTVTTVRDNVIFELGLFIGCLGKDRCFFIMPRSDEALHLPTDLIGITPLSFDAKRSDKNLSASLGPACNQIRKEFREKGLIRRSNEASHEESVQIDPVQAKQTALKRLLLRNVAQLYENVQPMAKSEPYGYADDDTIARFYNQYLEIARSLYSNQFLTGFQQVRPTTGYHDICIRIGQLKSTLESEESDPTG
jgi:hypothetical protein